MKRLLFLLLFLSSFALAQTPVSVGGNVYDTGGNLVTSGTVTFTLYPPSGANFYVPGIGAITSTSVDCPIASGLIACTLWGNDVISPANTCYQELVNGNALPTLLYVSGTTYSINSPKFCPGTKIVPQGTTVNVPPVAAPIIPNSDNAFTVGSPNFRYSNGWFNNFQVQGTATVQNLNVQGTCTGPGCVGGSANFAVVSVLPATCTQGTTYLRSTDFSSYLCTQPNTLTGFVNTGASNTFVPIQNFPGGINVGNAVSGVGSISFSDSTWAHTSTIQAPTSLAANYTVTLPGATGTMALDTTFNTIAQGFTNCLTIGYVYSPQANACIAAGGTPGGTTGGIQWNNAGVFGGVVITGLVKANGTSAPSAAVASTDYVPPTTTVNGHPLSANVTVTNTDIGSPTILGTPSVGNCVSWSTATQVQDAGSPCATGLNLTNVVAVYDMQTTSGGGTILNDVSGKNACSAAPANATFGASAPVINSYGALFTVSTAQTFVLPTCLNTSIVSIQIVAEAGANAFAAQPQKLLTASNGSLNATHYITTGSFATLAAQYDPSIYVSGSPVVIPGVGCFGVCDYAFTLGTAGNSHVYVNGVEAPYYHSGASGNSSAITGPYTLGGLFKGTMYYAIVYSAAVTSLQVQQNYNAVKNILASRGIVVNNYGQRQFQVNAGGYNAYTPTHGNPYLLVLGDSISVGYNGTAGGVTTWESVAQGDLTGPLSGLTWFTFGAMGFKSLSMIGAEINSWYPQLIDPPSSTLPIAPNIIVLFEATNDISLNGTETAAQTYSKARYAGSYLRALGFKVVFVPAISRITIDSRIQAFNALAMAHCEEFANVCVDPSDPAVYSTLYALGAYANTTYYQADGIHPTSTGQTLLGHAIAKALNRLYVSSHQANNSISLTAQTAAIASTQWINTAVAPTGVYRVCGYVETTTASGSGTPTLAGTIAFTDDVGAQTITLFTGFSLSATGSTPIGCQLINVASGAVNYATTITGAAGTPQYALKLNIERLP